MAVALVLTLLWTEYGDSVACRLGWVAKTQIVVAGTATVALLQLLFWFIVSLMFGRVYCSGFCPLGTWFDIVSRVANRLRRRPHRPFHYCYSRPHDRLRLSLLAVVLACMAVGLTVLPMVIEPANVWHDFCQSALHPLWGHINNMLASSGIPANPASRVAFVTICGASVSAVCVSVLILLAVSLPAMISGRTYCNTICPVGTALSMASRHSMWRIDIDTDACTGCGRCADACKASCIDLNDHVVDMSRCVNCYDCLTACDDNAIFYRPTSKQLSWPLLQDIKPGLDASPTATAAGPQNINHTNNQPSTHETISRPAATRHD